MFSRRSLFTALVAGVSSLAVVPAALAATAAKPKKKSVKAPAHGKQHAKTKPRVAKPVSQS